MFLEDDCKHNKLFGKDTEKPITILFEQYEVIELIAKKLKPNIEGELVIECIA